MKIFYKIKTIKIMIYKNINNYHYNKIIFLIQMYLINLIQIKILHLLRVVILDWKEINQKIFMKIFWKMIKI